MLSLKFKPENSRTEDNPRLEPIHESDLSIEQFMKRLRVSGRYFVGNDERKNYLKVHSSEIEVYLRELEKTNRSEAKLLREYVRINLRYDSPRAFSIDERLTMEEKKAYFPKKAGKTLSHYTPVPRRQVERFIFASLLVLSIPTALYVGRLCNDKIEKAVMPYIQKLYHLTETSDFYDGEE